MSNELTKIAIFKGKEIRKTIYNDEWWLSVEDVVLILILTDSVNVKDYMNKMRKRDLELNKGYGQIVHTLPINTADGRQNMNCAGVVLMSFKIFDFV